MDTEDSGVGVGGGGWEGCGRRDGEGGGETLKVEAIRLVVRKRRSRSTTLDPKIFATSLPFQSSRSTFFHPRGNYLGRPQNQCQVQFLLH